MTSNVKSNKIAVISGVSLIDKVIKVIKRASAKSEESTEYDGFLSYHAESHAAGSGLGIGFMIGASGDLSVLGAILNLVLYGNRGEISFSPLLLDDILSERPYFICSIIIGVIIGLMVRLILGKGVPYIQWLKF